MFLTAITRQTIDIPPASPLLGFDERQAFYPDGHHAILDPLHATVMIIKADNAPPAVLVSLDIATLQYDAADAYRHAIAEALNTQTPRVIIACTHTHSAPYPLKPRGQRSAIDEDHDREAVNSEPGDADPGAPQTESEDKSTLSIWEKAGHLFHQTLLDLLPEMALKAMQSLSPARPYFQTAPLGLSYNRRAPLIQTEDVQYIWNPYEQPDLPLKPGPDPTCNVLRFLPMDYQVKFDPEDPKSHMIQPEYPLPLLWEVGAHNLVLGKHSNVVSGDWVGRANQLLQQLLPGHTPLFVFGACGETHPWIATHNDDALIEPIAMTAAGMVASLAHAARPLPMETQLHISRHEILIGQLRVDTSVWRLGDIILLAAPVELFQSLSLRLRTACPDKKIILITEANGRTGYWPDAEAFDEGGYEVDIAKAYGLTAGDGEKLVDQWAKIINHN